MFSRTRRAAELLAVLALVAGSCDPTGSGGGTPASCPPFQGPETAVVGGNDQSGVEVPKGANPNLSGGVWCGSPPLKISGADLAALIKKTDSNGDAYGCFTNRADTIPPCYPFKGLGAVDLLPNNLELVGPPKALLKYDLSVHRPQQEGLTQFFIYQLKDPIPPINALDNRAWKYAGSAYLQNGFAQSKDIEHFSVFALIEPPQDVDPAGLGRGEFEILSEFIGDSQGTVSVEVRVLAFELGEPGEIKIVRWTRPDPTGSFRELAEACTSEADLDAQLTCLFPPTTIVYMTFEVGVTIIGIDGEYDVRVAGPVFVS